MQCVNCDKQIKSTDINDIDYMYEDNDVWCIPCADIEGDTGFVY